MMLSGSEAGGPHIVFHANITLGLEARIVPKCVAARGCCVPIEAFGKSSRQRKRNRIVADARRSTALHAG